MVYLRTERYTGFGFQTQMSFFLRNDRGQDLAEYCLLIALVALVACGLIVHFSGGVQVIWNSANNTLASGSPSAGSSSASSTSSAAGGGQSGGNAASRGR